jgi:acyl-CoA synthetase (AMP-forming)/AMP-acid ligase II
LGNKKPNLARTPVREKRINLYQAFIQQVNRIPNEDCIWTPQRTYTWTQTHQMIIRYAHWFISRGIQRGDIVAFYLQNSAEFMFAWLGLLAINAAPAMVNFNLTGKALVHCISVASAKLILVDDDIQDRILLNKDVLEMAIPFVVLSENMKRDIENLEAEALDESVTSGTDEKSTLALRYTSGTTGFPKAIKTPISRTFMLTYGKFDDMGLRPGPNGDRWYMCIPMCHATAGSTVMACMIMGITICVGLVLISGLLCHQLTIQLESASRQQISGQRSGTPGRR